MNDRLKAVQEGDTEAVKLLIQAGWDGWLSLASPYWSDLDQHWSDSAVRIAAEKGHTEIVRLWVLAGADVNVQAPVGEVYQTWTPLQSAAEKGHTEIVKLLIQAGADVSADGNAALMCAAKKGHEGAVRLLMQAGADIKAADSRSSTALHHATGPDFTEGRTEIVRLLIQAGADVNAADSAGSNVLPNGITPLHNAARRGITDVAKLLIKGGAIVNARDNSGRSPLQWALDMRHFKTADLLRNAKIK